MMTNFRHRSGNIAGTIALAALVGCGGASSKYDANVQGSVTIDDELAHGGSVTFTPLKKGPTAVGTIADDGSYSLRIGQGDVGSPDSSEIPAGEYVVTAMITGTPAPREPDAAAGPPPAGPKLIADKYGSRDTSDLKFEVKQGPNIIVLKLDGPWANPPAEEEAVDEGTKKEADANIAETPAVEPAKNGAAAEPNAPLAPAETADEAASEEAKP